MRVVMKETVLILTDAFPPNIGGVESHLYDLCKYLAESDHRVFVVTYQPITTKAKGLKVERRKNLEIHRMQWFGYNLYPKLESYPILLFLYEFPGLFVSSLFFLLKRRKEIDVIHAQGLITGYITKILVKIFKKRCVVTLHAIFNFHRRPILAKMAKWILSSFDVIITLAKKSRDELTAIGLSGGKMKLCTHWVDLNEFRPLNRNKCKENLGLNRKFVILFVGRFIAKKGIDVLLDVASEVNPEVVFAFIGDGPLSAKIRERARDQQNIIFVGKVPKEDLVRYYNAADSLIIPSQYEELFGRVVIEALACGTPVIASNKGTLPEIVDPSVGIVVDPSREDIVKVVNFLYENPEQLARMRSNCRHYASANFSEKNAEDIASAYKID